MSYQKYIRELESLSKLDFNYDASAYEKEKEKAGWNIDRRREKIGKEAPGPVVDGGPFARAQAMIQRYEFPDPRLIRAIFNPADTLDGRNMLLRATFLGFTFYFGVRIVRTIDETSQSDDGRYYHWGYAYRTLKGHFEIGQIQFRISKNLDTGDIYFEIDAYSKADRIPNFFYRLGFRIFGRQLQTYFANSAFTRLRKALSSTHRAPKFTD